MKNYFRILLLSTITLLFLFSCEKEAFEEEQTNQIIQQKNQRISVKKLVTKNLN